MTDVKPNIIRPTAIQKIKSFVDDLERFEAERTLTNPTERDIDDYLFLHNTVAGLMDLPDKINELIAIINAILEVVDPPAS